MKTGEPFATEWNAMVDCLTSMQGVGGPGVYVTRTPFGTANQAKPPRGVAVGKPTTPGTFSHFKISSHGSDTLTCYKWDDAADDWEAGTTTVYKPYLLRFTSAPSSRTIDTFVISYGSYDTTDQTRVATVGIGGDTYTEVLTQRYLADDLIIAVYTEESGGLRWVDLNVDGRAWAKKFSA